MTGRWACHSNGYQVVNERGQPIATIHTREGQADLTRGEVLVRARLMAAAPQLFAALASFVDCALEIPEPLLSEARAALAKARGEVAS